MSNRVEPEPCQIPIAQAFGSDCVVLPIASILPVKAIEKTVKSSHKYRQIAASIREIGLVEPPVVIRDARDANSTSCLTAISGSKRSET